MPQSGPFQSYEIPVNVATVTELARVVVPVEGAPVYCVATGSTWYSSFTLPGGRTVSVDGSSGAITASNGTYWLQGGAAGDGAAFNTVAAGAAGSGRLLDVSLAFLLVLNAGAAFFVKSQLAVWRWIPTSTVAGDNKTTCNPTSNGVSAGRFERDPVANVVWQHQATWKIASTLGSDEGDGSLASPLATFAEFQRRVGPLFDAPQTTTVTLLEDAPNEYIVPSISPTTANQVVINGTLVQMAGPFVVSAVTPISRAGNQETVITSTWTNAQIGRLAKLADGANAGASAWVEFDNTGGALSTLPWNNLSSLGVNTAPVVTNPSVGNTVNTFLPTKIGGLSVDVRGAKTGGNAQLVIQDLVADNTAVTPLVTTVSPVGSGNVCFQRVKFTGVGGPRSEGGFSVFTACLWSLTGTLFGNSMAAFATVQACGLLSGVSLSVSRGSTVLVTGDTLTMGVVGPSFTVTNGALLRVGDVCCKNPAAGSDFVSTTGGARVNFEGAIYGAVGRRVISAIGGDVGYNAGAASFPITCAAGEGFAFGGGIVSGFAYDVATGLPIAGLRNYTFANLLATVGAGGFGGAVWDPNTAQRVLRTG